MPTYEVSFAAEPEPGAPEKVGERLPEILQGVPGVHSVRAESGDTSDPRERGTFLIEVRDGLGIAAAARDASRLAKEALSLAGAPDARLVELNVRLVGPAW